MKKVLIADDHPLMLSGIEAVLKDTDYDVVATETDGVAVLEALPGKRPDILILDITMPGRSGMDVLRVLRSRGDMRPVVLLTARIEDDDLVEALKLGAAGILLKDGAHELLLRCLDRVASGQRWIDRELMDRALQLTMSEGEEKKGRRSKLTAKERVIAGLVSQGLRNREIASELGVTEGTVKVYLHRMYEKCDVGSRTELALLFRLGVSD